MCKVRELLILSFVLLMWACRTGWAIEFRFQPDTTRGNAGDTVLLSGTIGPSETLRGFTIYLANDTNVIDLAEPPMAGSLISARQGIDFRYLDHVPSEPDWLEIGATVFSTDYWAGPGELFRVRFVLRRCADTLIPASIGFRRPDATYIAGTYDPPEFFICAHTPQAPQGLTISPALPDGIVLRWNPVTQDTSGQELPAPAHYRIWRQQVLPANSSAEVIASVSDTVYTDTFPSGTDYLYQVTAQSGP